MNIKRNAEGYSDPTAYAAITRIDKDEQRIRHLKKVLGEICALSGYRIKGDIVLVDKRSGHTVRL